MYLHYLTSHLANTQLVLIYWEIIELTNHIVDYKHVHMYSDIPY